MEAVESKAVRFRECPLREFSLYSGMVPKEPCLVNGNFNANFFVGSYELFLIEVI